MKFIDCLMLGLLVVSTAVNAAVLKSHKNARASAERKAVEDIFEDDGLRLCSSCCEELGNCDGGCCEKSGDLDCTNCEKCIKAYRRFVKNGK